LIHGSGLLFTSFSAEFAAETFCGEIPYCAMKPTAEYRMFRELPRFCSQCQENALRHVFSPLIVGDQTQRGGMDEINVTMH
jgi:hypothetical protein